MARSAPTPTKMTALKLFYLRDSESGLAAQFVDAGTADKVKRSVWLPLSQLYKILKEPKADGDDYPIWKCTVPEWLVSQKNLSEFEV
jgi:hypothetical protein